MKYILVCLLLVINLNATSKKFIEKMGYETSYDLALQKAKDSNKTLMMIASTKDCPWCRKLERQTLKKENISDFIKKNFIALSVDKDKANYPKKFEVKVVPTIYFINPKDESVINRTLGYKNKKDLKIILEKVVEK